MSSSESVKRWLAESDDVASVVSSAVDVARSEFGEFDEGRYCLVEETVELAEGDEAVKEVVTAALGDVARVAQRRAVGSLHRLYARGRMTDVPSYASNSVVRTQKFFRLENFHQMTTLEDPVLMQGLIAGSYRIRLGGMTGIGKTRKLPGLIAAKCGLRVCQLELDAPTAQEALEVQKKAYGIPGGLKSWSRTRKAFLTAMSYHEFRGNVLSGNRDRLFADFDVFYMDESHDPSSPVWAARQYFAEFARPETSLLVVSATVSTEESNNTVASRTGKFEVATEPTSFEQALESGDLLGRRLRDRTLVLVASDEQVAMGKQFYADQGIEVRGLDSASTAEDRRAVDAMLRSGTSVVPRVLVANASYGTAYNFAVSFVVSTCTVRVYELDEKNALVEKEVPLMAKAVVQHQGRVGRGLATGAGGYLLSPVTAPDKELMVSEVLDAYLSLVAAGIRPRPGAFDAVTRVLPKGMNATVARMLLRCAMPPALAARYLGSDGLFARRYVEAVKLFSQTGEVLRPSRDEFPVGYDTWVSEVVGGYYEGDETVTDVEVRVPFESPAGLKVMMHTMSAVAEGKMELEYWNWYYEDEESEDELVGKKVNVRRKVLLSAPEQPVRTVESSSATLQAPWQYDADPDKAVVKKRRQAMSWTANGEGKAAVTALLRALESSSLGETVVQPEKGVPEFPGKVVYALPLDDDPKVPVKSAGGGNVLVLTLDVYKLFMRGESLSPEQTLEVVKHLVECKNVARFAKSTVFDNWSSAWLCWFSTMGDVEVVTCLRDNGFHSQAMKLLNLLYDRFRAEVISVAVSSNLYKESLTGFFRSKPSVTKFVKAVQRGRLPIAQSDAFVKRVVEIKDSYDVAVLAVETTGVFAPGQVTKAQRALPIRDKNRKLPVIDESVVAGKDVSTLLETDTRWRT